MLHFTHHLHGDAACAVFIIEIDEDDLLPGTERHFRVDEGDGEACFD